MLFVHMQKKKLVLLVDNILKVICLGGCCCSLNDCYIETYPIIIEPDDIANKRNPTPKSEHYDREYQIGAASIY